VAIGLAVMFLMLSLVGTAVNEIIATLINLRPRYLSSALKAILDDEDLKKAFYKTGIVAGVNAALGKHPAYISSRNFSLALVSSLDPAKPLPTLDDLTASVQKLPQSNIRDVLLTQISAANGDLDKLRTGLAMWFDSAMDRVGGLYKRNLQFISVVVGIALSILFNADSLSVSRALWQDPALRASMVAEAQRKIDDARKNPPPAQTQPASDATATPDPAAEQLKIAESLANVRAAYDNANAALEPLPIGWHGTEFASFWEWLTRPMGWLVTGLAVSLGAPFWFDLLSKFMNLRGAGGKPARADDSDSS
jgi:hypothetical protein